jgi:hypothetical protein
MYVIMKFRTLVRLLSGVAAASAASTAVLLVGNPSSDRVPQEGQAHNSPGVVVRSVDGV